MNESIGDTEKTDIPILIIREYGKTRYFSLTNQDSWTLGRATPDNTPDIPLKSEIAGRKHGEFLLVNSQLFYVDRGSINGTCYNGKRIKKGLKGLANPILLNDGDVLLIDCGEPDASDSRRVSITIQIRD